MMNSRAYCKTRHDGRMWNFNQEMTRNIKKRVTAGLPKMYPSFLKMCPSFLKKYLLIVLKTRSQFRDIGKHYPETG